MGDVYKEYCDFQKDVARVIDPIGMTPLDRNVVPVFPEEHTRIVEALRKADVIITMMQQKSNEENQLAALGRNVLDSIETLRQEDGPFKDWTPAECPSEIILDMNEHIKTLLDKLAGVQ